MERIFIFQKIFFEGKTKTNKIFSSSYGLRKRTNEIHCKNTFYFPPDDFNKNLIQNI